MKRYNTDKMLEAWSTVSSLSSTDPYPASVMDGEDPEDLMTQGDSDMVTNVPSVDGYDVNKSIHRKSSKLKISEAQDQEEVVTQGPAPKQNTQSQSVPPDMQAPEGMDPSMMQDPNTMAGGQDPSMMGMGMGMGGPTSTFDVGRVYELKKIYSRLVSMQSYLAGTTDPNLIKLRNYVAGSMDLFRTLISNIALYKDRLDEIIVVFYKVVDNVYSILSKYYKDKDSGKMVQAIESSIYISKRSKK